MKVKLRMRVEYMIDKEGHHDGAWFTKDVELPFAPRKGDWIRFVADGEHEGEPLWFEVITPYIVIDDTRETFEEDLDRKDGVMVPVRPPPVGIQCHVVCWAREKDFYKNYGYPRGKLAAEAFWEDRCGWQREET